MEIETDRGFVYRIEIGRAGLVTIHLVHDDGTTAAYVIADLDADPERFNERLSKLGLLRDAMNRAEPVEIEHAGSEAGRVIERVVRISRDTLDPIRGNLELVTGLVLEAMLHAENRTGAADEAADHARVRLLTTEIKVADLTLNMQIPERPVAVQQFEMIREAQQGSYLIRLLVEGGQDSGDLDNQEGFARLARRIIAVAVDYNASAFGSDEAIEVSGFVESLSLISLSQDDAAGNFAHVRFTTAPDFSGPGGTVGLTPFTPQLLNLLVPKNSDTYELFVAGLRDNLRMRVSVTPLGRGKDKDQGRDEGAKPAGATNVEAVGENIGLRYRQTRIAEASAQLENIGLAFTAELLAPLASASRPVWITISRTSLDYGPEGFACTPGVPTSDLRPQTLRDLRIPYSALWTGVACFNHGIYRFQFKLPTAFEVKVDGETLCLHDAQEGVKMAHACLGSEHEVCVEIEDWICDYEFIMDVYRIR